MKFIAHLLLFVILITACGPATPAPTRAPENIQPERPTPTPDFALQPADSGQTGYPPPPSSPTPYPEGYPIPPAQAEPLSPYPAAESSGRVTVIHALGIQCEDASRQKYANAQDARAGLIAASVTVYEITTVDLMVCQACGCPTSAHFQAEIATTDLNKALALGWVRE